MENDQQESTEVNILDDLDELDKAIIRYKIEGVKNVEIAEKLGKHRDTIAGRLEKPKVQFAIKELQKTAIQIIIGAQVDAAREIVRQIKKGKEVYKLLRTRFSPRKVFENKPLNKVKTKGTKDEKLLKELLSL